MKNHSIISAAIVSVALGFAAIGLAQTMKQTPTTSTMTSSLKLVSVGAPTTGSVEITDGTVKFKNLKTEAGPDLHVYLYAAAIPDKKVQKLGATFVDLGKLGAPFKGNFNYKIPVGTDLKQFKSLIIWCDVAKVTFAGANL
jgi:hypothetical protein